MTKRSWRQNRDNCIEMLFHQKWWSRPGDGAGSLNPVVGDGEGGDSTGFLLKREVMRRT